MNSNLKKLLGCLMALVLSFGVIVGLAACGQSEEKIIEGQLAAELDQIKDTSEENVRELLGDDGYQELMSFGLDPQEFYSAMFSKFEYESKGVTINGDDAVASLTVTNIDLEKGIENYTATIEDWATTEEAQQLYLEGGEDALYETVAKMLVDALTDPSLPTKTNDVQLDLHKVDGTWELTDETAAMNALFGGGADIANLF